MANDVHKTVTNRSALVLDRVEPELKGQLQLFPAIGLLDFIVTFIL